MSTTTHILTLRVSLVGCRYDIRVNDVPIFRDMIEGLPITATMSVNEYLRPGANRITVQLLSEADGAPLPPPSEPLFVALLGRNARAPKIEDAQAFRLDMALDPGAPAQLRAGASAAVQPGAVLGPVDHRPDRFAAAIDFTLAGPAHQWKWLTSAPIAYEERTYRDLLALFESWLKRLEARDAAWIAPAMQERFAEMALALFEPASVVADHGLYEAVADKTASLFDPDLKHARLMVFGEGRLATIVRWDEKPLVVFLHDDGVNADYYPIIVRREGAGWVICR